MMMRKRLWYAVLIVLSLVAVLEVALMWRPHAQPVPKAPPSSPQPITYPPLRVGHRAPDFTLNEIQNGSLISLSHYAGSPVLFTFVTTTCQACASELNILSQAATDKTLGFHVVAIAVAEYPGTVYSYVQSRGLLVPILVDPKGWVAHRLYHVTSLPSSVLLSSHGRVLGIHAGSFSSVTALTTYANPLIHAHP